MKMRCYFCFCALIIPTITTEILVNSNSTIKESDNTTIRTEQITQPLHSQSQQIESVQAPHLNNSSSNDEKKFKTSTASEFKPSVQLETYYEFNKVPVRPALPEPKTKSEYWNTKSVGGIVKFPPVPSSAAPAKSDSFQYSKLESEYKAHTPDHGFQFNKPVPTAHDGYKPYKPVTSLEPYSNEYVHKTHHEYNLYEKPPTSEILENPWKKIIKFLTAAIPIGLLISALTPTVITVTPVNDTLSRSRTTKNLPQNNKTRQFIPCENRILCELLLSATTSSNGEQHVENLLNTFTERHSTVKTEDLKKIFDAVKNQNCDTITCSPNMKIAS